MRITRIRKEEGEDDLHVREPSNQSIEGFQGNRFKLEK